MAGKLDDGAFDIPCPECGHKNRKTLGWLKTHKQFTCAGCGNVTIETGSFREGMRKVDAAIGKLDKRLNKTFRIKL